MDAVAEFAPPAAIEAKPVKVNITAAKGRPMLTWVGKRPLSHVTAFPAQRVERHDALRIVGIDPQNIDTDDEKMEFFRDLRSQCNNECWKDAPFINGVWTPEVGGVLMHGDNKDVLAFLLANGYRERVNLVYIDPPFDSGADYVRTVSLRGAKTTELQGEGYTIGEQMLYTDIWANDNYLQFMYERLLLLKELLTEGGSIYLHCDTSKGHHLRCLLDDAFGADNFRNEIIWFYENKLGTGGETFDGRHDSLLVYTKGRKWTHHDILLDVKERKMQPVTQKIEGKRVWLRDEEGKRVYREGSEARPVGDVWTIPIINPVAAERTGFRTQKPEQLLQWVVQASSRPGDLVLDCFLGSGTTVAVAQKLGRRWIGSDINKGAIQTTVKRLRGIVAEQIGEARRRGAANRQGKLIEEDVDSEPPPKPCAFGFTVWRVNDYDLQIQHNEAVNLACEHIGIERTRTDSYFDGTLGKKLVKIIPFGHPLTPLDLEELKRELDSRPDEDRGIVVVCLGMELAAKALVDDWNRLRKGAGAVNRIEVIELRTDPKYGKFIKHEPATAKVKIARKKRGDEERIVVEIQDFISPTILERLRDQAGILSPKIDDWRAMVDCVYIDTAYNGTVLNVALADVPERKADLVSGKYELPAQADETTVAVKIVDMLGEEVLVTQKV